MPDIVFLLVAGGFFGLCALYIKGCERILRGGEGGEGGDVGEVTQ